MITGGSMSSVHSDALLESTPSTDAKVTPAQLSEALVNAWHTITQRAVGRFAEHGITPNRVRVINLISEGPLRMGALADRLGVTGRTATLIVDDLVAEGLVERLPDPVDRRAMRVVLAPRGRGMLLHIERLQREISEEVFSVLHPRERVLLSGLLERCTDHGATACRSTDSLETDGLCSPR